jgi:hypothetical protein
MQMKKYYYFKIGEKTILSSARTDSGALKQAERLGEGVQVWYDHPDESWAARLVGVSKGRKRA